MADARIILFSPREHQNLLPAIVELHVQCINFDGALLRFHPPFTEEKRERMAVFWRERIEQITADRRIMILALSSYPSSHSSSAAKLDGQDAIAGLVELGLPEAETGPFRADVEMLMVSPQHRKGGVGKKLMQELESIASARRRTLLVSSICALPKTNSHMPASRILR